MKKTKCSLISLLAICFLSNSNCSGIISGLNKSNTHSSGAIATPSNGNTFQGGFEYESFDFLKGKIMANTSFWYTYFHNTEYLTPEEASALVSKLPKGGHIKIEHINQKAYINGDTGYDTITNDSIKVYMLNDTTQEIPAIVTNIRKTGAFGKTSTDNFYITNKICYITEAVPDSFYVKNWIKYSGSFDKKDSSIVNSWKVYLRK